MLVTLSYQREDLAFVSDAIRTPVFLAYCYTSSIFIKSFSIWFSLSKYMLAAIILVFPFITSTGTVSICQLAYQHSVYFLDSHYNSCSRPAFA